MAIRSGPLITITNQSMVNLIYMRKVTTLTFKGAMCKNWGKNIPKNELNASKEWEEIRAMMSFKKIKLELAC